MNNTDPPVPEYLEKLDVCRALGVGEAALASLIEAGEFPAGIPWGGREKRWKKTDVTWFYLHRDVIARLAPPAPEEDPEPEAPKTNRKV